MVKTRLQRKITEENFLKGRKGSYSDPRKMHRSPNRQDHNLKEREEDRVLKAVREYAQLTCEHKSTRRAAEFSIQTLSSRKAWRCHKVTDAKVHCFIQENYLPRMKGKEHSTENVLEIILQTQEREKHSPNTVEWKQTKLWLPKTADGWLRHKEPPKQKRNDSNKHTTLNNNFNC